MNGLISLPMLRYSVSGALLAVATSTAAAPEPIAVEPIYKPEPCCQLCPAALEQSNYQGSELESMWPVVEGKDGWLFRARSDFATEFGPKPAVMAMLKQFVDALDRRGSRLMMIYTPSRGLMERDKSVTPFNYSLALKNYRQTLAEYRKMGVITPPLDQLIGQMAEDYYFKRDIHWTPAGSKATAKLSAQLIKQEPFYSQLPDKQYSTQVSGYSPIDGSMHRAAIQLCKQGYPMQYWNEYQTTETSGADDLLAEESSPQIVLLGTSFTALPKFNFDGFLREALGKDVMNVAMTGGEDRGAWLEYLPSDGFQKTPPKLIIWETPSHYSLSDKSLFRQLIPLVDNGCANSTPLMEGKQEIQPTAGQNELVFSQELLKEKAGELVMDMTVSDPTVHELEVTAWYGNGTSEAFKVKQNSRANTGGRFVFLLAQDDSRHDQPFISLDLTKVKSTESKVSIATKVCRQPDLVGLQTARR